MHWTNWVLTAVVLVVLALAYGNVEGADLAAKDKQGSVFILHDRPCSSDYVLFVMTRQHLPTAGLKNAQYFSVAGGATKGCWDVNPKTGQIFAIFENGTWSTNFYIHQFGPEGKEFKPHGRKPSKSSVGKKQFFTELFRSTVDDGYIASDSNGSYKSGRRVCGSMCKTLSQNSLVHNGL